MIDREHGEPVVMDFGLARSMRADESNITHLGKILGTPYYMSPEQVEGDFEQIGPGTDIYSLGVVLYQLLTGRLPFEGPVSKVLVLIQTQAPVPPSTHRADLDPLLEAICLKAMAKQAVDRYDTMQEFGNALAAWLKQTRHQTSEPGTVRSGGRTPESLVETQSVAGDEQDSTLNDRIVNPGSEPLADLGFRDELRADIQELVARGSGVLLACGPAASGATTTACAIVRSIDTYQYSIFSIAEPEALDLAHVESYQGDPDDTLARSLHRCVHLFEPDIIFLDPIRDSAAAKAVFLCEDDVTLISEFSANDAAIGILQLIQWTGRPDLVANRLLGICSQRLIRRLCPDCREPFRPNPAILSKVGLPESVTRLYRTPRSRAAGSGSSDRCPTCGGSGYAGQTGLFELIRMSDPIKQIVSGTPTTAAIRAQARRENMPRFQQPALNLVVEGQTSVDELRRVFKRS
jgi:type IV pilus assembly protein PilB